MTIFKKFLKNLRPIALIFLLVISFVTFVTPKFTLAEDDASIEKNMKTIQTKLKNSGNNCIKFCFDAVIKAKNVDTFKEAINSNDIPNCISDNQYEGAVCMLTAGETDLLGKLRNYINNPTSDNRDIVLNWFEESHPIEAFTPAIEEETGPCGLPVSGWSWNPIDWIVGGITYGLFIITRGVLVLCLKIFEFLLNPNNFNGYIHFLNTSIVEEIWREFKNLANLGILIGMIITAIATILRIEKYSWKKMLPKLLLVALLVNFSLVISGMFVDISNFFSISAASKFSDVTLPTIIVDQTICPVVNAFFLLKEGGGWPLLRASFLGLVLSGIFLFTFVGLTIYVFSRIITIIVCLVTSPLAFLSFAIPGGEKLWDFWRQRFQQAIVVLPILCFILYLSLRFISILINNIK